MSSIMEFWGQMTANPLLFIAVVLTMGVILVNGWTDAPNAIATLKLVDAYLSFVSGVTNFE